MVFSNLQSHEKDAFFSLLDEYFASRPEVLGNTAGTSGGAGSGIGGAGAGAGGAAASAVHRAFANNPEATSRLVSAGLKHGVPKSSPYSAAASDPEIANAAGRVAAAGLSFSARNHGGGSTSPPQRSAPPVAEKPSGVAGLVSSRRFGDLDTTSKGNFLGSLYTPGKNKSPPPADPPAAPAPSGGWKNKFGPPPPRSVAAEPAPKPASPPPPEPEPQEEEAAHGEWANVLYDYNSGEATDLVIKAGERVLVTERTSDDWWTGESDGKSGLFPASYVKLL